MSEQKIGRRQIIGRDMWQNTDYRQHLLRSMRIDMFARLVDAGDGWMQASVPVETLRYLPPGYFHFASFNEGGPALEVPAHLAEAGEASWEAVEVSLSMRIKPADQTREAAP